MSNDQDRREFLKGLLPCSMLLLGVAGPFAPSARAEGAGAVEEGAEKDRYYAMGIQVDRCIGCGLCVQACKEENNVLREPFFYRTWVERYAIDREGHATVDSPDGGRRGFPPLEDETDVVRSFFVPKLCNQCDKPPCVQVCPVGATYKSPEGVVLVDADYCIGCRYCIQACPYGARYLDPRTHVADKCTFCYHRIKNGQQPACVEVCPTQARVFGDLHARSSPLGRLRRQDPLHVLKPELNTDPKVIYSNLDGEVR